MQHHTHTHARAFQKFAALGVACIAALGLTLGAASPALAHDELLDTGLEFDSATDELNAISLVFSNDIMPVGTEIIVTDGADTNVSSAEPEISGPTVRQALDAPLAVGGYEAVWRVVSSDGHPIQGAFNFQVAEDGTAEIVAEEEIAAEEEEHSHAADEEDAHAADVSDDTTDMVIATREDSSFPVGGWIALAVVIVVGAGAFIALSKRKKSASAAQSVNADPSAAAGTSASTSTLPTSTPSSSEAPSATDDNRSDSVN